MRDNTGGYLETAVNMGKVLLPEGIITSLVNKEGESFVYRSYIEEPPFKLDEKVAKLHLAKIGVELSELSQEQADYIGVAQQGPFKPEYYRY